jgi:hypothetical protein
MRQSTVPLAGMHRGAAGLGERRVEQVRADGAVAGWMPNSSTSSGVISEPPPTPVRPTMAPTTNPAMCRPNPW